MKQMKIKCVVAFVTAFVLAVGVFAHLTVPSFTATVYAASRVVYSMAEDSALQSQSVGSSQATQSTAIAQSGGPRLAVVAAPGGHRGISISNRNESWYTIDFRRDTGGIGINLDANYYQITLRGRVVDPTVGTQIIIGAPSSPWNWLHSAAVRADGTFDFTAPLDSEVIAETHGGPAQFNNGFRISTNTIADFYIYDFIIEQIPAAARPEPEPEQEFEAWEGITLIETSFETGDDGLQGRGSASVARVRSQSNTGNYSMRITGRTATWNGAIVNVTSLSESFDMYEFSVWVMPIDEPAEFQITAQFSSEGGDMWRGFSGPQARQMAEPGEWTELRGRLTFYEFDRAYLIIETHYPHATTSFYVDDLEFRNVTPQYVLADVPSLHEVYADYFIIGTAIAPPDLRGTRFDFINHHFNAITAGNDMKPDALQPRAGVFNFDVADHMVELALDNDIAMIGHTLAWHSQSPEWMNPRGISRQQAIRNLEEHITEVVTRYRGQVVVWDVVNEAFPSSVPLATASDWRANLRPTPWLAAIGYEYIEIAFRAAHAADPNAILIYNDYNLNQPGKREAVFHMVQEFLERGVPIHGVGMQGHYSLQTYLGDVEASIMRFAELGLPISFTELDVTVPNSAGQARLTASQELQQAIFYAQLFQVFRRHHEVIDRVTFWGLDDATSWRSDRFPLIFNEDLSPKKSFFAVLDPDEFLREQGLYSRSI